MPWTGRTHTRRVLGGHFVQEDIVIEFPGDNGPGVLMLRGYHASRRWPCSCRTRSP